MTDSLKMYLPELGSWNFSLLPDVNKFPMELKKKSAIELDGLVLVVFVFVFQVFFSQRY